GEFGEYMYNPMGGVHGGVVATLLDSAMGCAVMTTLDEKTGYTTADMNVHLVRPITAATGAFAAEGTVVHRGRKMMTVEAKLLDGNGKLLAHATSTCIILQR
ncbi:MAG TPA: PaaI family thioesterase, partial [Kofleriaceae bacterium]